MTLTQMRSRLKMVSRDFGGIQANDTNLDTLLNEGYEDFVRRTHILRKSDRITLSPETYTFSLPSDCMTPLRFQFDKRVVDLVSDDFLDARKGYDWREHTGSAVTYLTQQMTGYDSIRIYPAFEDFEEILYDIDDTHDKIIVTYDGGDATTVTLDHSSYTGEQLATELAAEISDAVSATVSVSYSTTTGIFTFSADGTIALTYSGSTAADRLGMTTDIAAATSIVTPGSVYLTVDYVYKPTALSADSDEPDFSSDYHMALVWYALHALLEMRVGIKQDVPMSMMFRTRYMGLAGTAKIQVATGFGRGGSDYIISPSFI